MAEIAYKIGEGNFSLVLKRIAAILLTEYTAQRLLGNTFLPTSVSYDTLSAVNENDVPFVSVNWMKMDNVADHRAYQSNMNQFFIEVKAVGYDIVRKIIEVTRVILKSQQYISLSYSPGVISETNVISAGVTFEDNNRSSQGVISGGLTFQCLVNESNTYKLGTDLDNSIYELEINDSNKVLTLKNTY